LACGIGLGTVAFLLHGCVSQTWAHMGRALQVAFAAESGCLVWPVLDGVTIGHLSAGENGRNGSGKGKQKEYVRERLYGAVSWAGANLLGLAHALDRVGFKVMYPLSVLAAGGGTGLRESVGLRPAGEAEKCER
jgi:hypothetical protein